MILRQSFDPRSVGALALWLDAADTPSAWTDKSGNGRNASQLATNNQPALQALGGRPAFYFDGINDTLALPVIPLAGWHAFAAYSPNNTGSILYIASGDTQAFTLTSSGTAGVLVASGSPATSAALYGVDGRIGASWSQGALRSFYRGLIGEILVYPSALSSAQVTAVTRYLSRKWGV